MKEVLILANCSFLLRGIPKTDWPALIGDLGDADLDSPRRSTVPLLAYWQDPVARLAWIETRLSVGLAAPFTFSFEHAVGVARGRGKPSCTDLIILAQGAAIALEAKYTEPEYERVSAWLHEPRDPNRSEVLCGWLEMIQAATGVALTVDSVLDFPYQLVHRTASACFPEAAHRAVLYQVFKVEQRERYLGDLRKLRSLLVMPELKLGVLTTPAVPLEVGAGLLTRWDGGERRMAHAVRPALLAAELFRFGEPSLSLV